MDVCIVYRMEYYMKLKYNALNWPVLLTGLAFWVALVWAVC